MPRLKTKLIKNPDTKARYFSTHWHKPIQLRSHHWNGIKFDAPHCNQVHIGHAHKNLVKSDPPHKIQLISTKHWNQVSFDTHSKFKSFIDASTQKPSQFRSRHWNQIKFDALHWNQVNFDQRHKKLMKFDSPHKDQVNFDPITDIKSISVPTPVSWGFRFPAKENDLISRPVAKIAYTPCLCGQNRVPFYFSVHYAARTPSDWPTPATTRRWPHFRRVDPILAT